MKQRNNILIENALISDADMIARIENECFSAPWSLKQIEEEIAKENVIFIKAVCDNTLIGYVSGQMILDEFYISNVAVTAPYRKMGVGNKLISELIDMLKNTDCVFATLEVRQSNKNAISLYEKFGFENLGIRKNFYSLPTENAYIYTLRFDN